MRKPLVIGYSPCSRKPQTRINTSFSASAQGHTRYVRNRRNLFFSALISQISLRIQQMSSSNQNQNTTKTTVSIFHHLQPQPLSSAVGSEEEIIYAWPIIVICGSRPTNRQSADCLNCFTKNREDAIERTIKQRKKNLNASLLPLPDGTTFGARAAVELLALQAFDGRPCLGGLRKRFSLFIGPFFLSVPVGNGAAAAF